MFLHACGIDPWPLPGAEYKECRDEDDDQFDGQDKSDLRDKRMLRHAGHFIALRQKVIDMDQSMLRDQA